MSAPASSSAPSSKKAPRQKDRRACRSAGERRVTRATAYGTLPRVRFLPAAGRAGVVLACAAIFAAVLPTAAAAYSTCGGKRATIEGKAHGETIYGTRGDDVISAAGGNDVVYGR